MIRNLKAIGLCLTAALALSAIAASAAQAAPEFTAFNTELNQHEAATLTGTALGKHIFKATSTSGVAVECGVAEFSGTSETGKTETQLMSPTFGECTSNPGNLKTDVHVNGCGFEFHISKRITENMEYEGKIDLVCEGPSGIVFEITKEGGGVKCEIEFVAQSGVSAAKYVTTTNLGINTTDVDYNIKAENMKTVARVGTLKECGVAPGTYTTGVYEGSDTVKAFNSKSNQIDLTGMG